MSAAGLCIGSVVLLLASGIPLALWASADGRGPGRTLLLAIAAVMLAASVIAALLAWHIRIIDRQEQYRLAALRAELDQTATAMACTSARLSTALAELPEQVRDRAAVQGRAVLARTDGIGQQLVELRERMEVRVAAIEKRVDSMPDEGPLDGDDRYLAGFADGLAGRALGEGTVVSINGNGHRKGS